MHVWIKTPHLHPERNGLLDFSSLNCRRAGCKYHDAGSALSLVPWFENNWKDEYKTVVPKVVRDGEGEEEEDGDDDNMV